jgi:hypothetical protein
MASLTKSFSRFFFNRCSKLQTVRYKSTIRESPYSISTYALGKGKGDTNPYGYVISEREWTTNPTDMGDDSLFVTPLVEMHDSQFMGLGVADGVGGWSLVPGGRPALIAQGLMKHSETIFGEYLQHIHATPFHPGYICPIVTAQAVERLIHKPPGKGASTSVIAVCKNPNPKKNLASKSFSIFNLLSFFYFSVYRVTIERRISACVSLFFCWRFCVVYF